MTEPVVSDLDADGSSEIVIYVGGTPARLLVFRDNGALAWSADVGPGSEPGWSSHIPLVADINNDGRYEVIVHSLRYDEESGPQSSLFAFDGSGSMLDGWPISVPPDLRPTLIAGDIDRDGSAEIVVKGNDALDRKMLVISGSGQIKHEWALPTKNWSTFGSESSPALGNFDDDPQLEIVSAGPSELAGFDFETNTVNNTGAIHVYNGDGTVVSGWPRHVEGVIFSSPAVGDLDGDGRHEIVVGTEYFSEIFPDLRYGGLYAFDRDGNVLPGWPLRRGYNFASSPSLGDIDNDGDLEVAASALGFETYVVHHDGSLAAGWPQFTAWNDYYSTLMADVDGNGKADILTTAGSHFIGGGVYAWDASGSPIEGFPKLTEVDAQAAAVVADLDGDGYVELVASSSFDMNLDEQRLKNRSSVYVWDLDGTADDAALPWSQFHQNARHDGLYCKPHDPACIALRHPEPPTPDPDTPTPSPDDGTTPTPTPTASPDPTPSPVVTPVPTVGDEPTPTDEAAEATASPTPPPVVSDPECNDGVTGDSHYEPARFVLSDAPIPGDEACSEVGPDPNEVIDPDCEGDGCSGTGDASAWTLAALMGMAAFVLGAAVIAVARRQLR
jgi:hypothetical protein